MNRYPTFQISYEIAAMIIRCMPSEKKEVLEKALTRNFIFTSSWVLEQGALTIYKEGWYLELFGTRCVFSVYAEDNDGEFVFKRKAPEKSLHKLYEQSLHFSESDFRDFNKDTADKQTV